MKISKNQGFRDHMSRNLSSCTKSYDLLSNFQFGTILEPFGTMVILSYLRRPETIPDHPKWSKVNIFESGIDMMHI